MYGAKWQEDGGDDPEHRKSHQGDVEAEKDGEDHCGVLVDGTRDAGPTPERSSAKSSESTPRD